MINGNMIGIGSAPLKTVILTDENGNEIIGICVDSVQVFTADDSKVAAGYTYASNDGVSTGTREFISYRTEKSEWIVLPQESFSIPLDHYNMYDYTEFQCMIAKFNTTINDSVSIEKVSIAGNVYMSNSSDVISNVTKNNDEKSIELNIVNNTEDSFIIYYFMYKQEEL